MWGINYVIFKTTKVEVSYKIKRIDFELMMIRESSVLIKSGSVKDIPDKVIGKITRGTKTIPMERVLR